MDSGKAYFVVDVEFSLDVVLVSFSFCWILCKALTFTKPLSLYTMNTIKIQASRLNTSMHIPSQLECEPAYKNCYV